MKRILKHLHDNTGYQEKVTVVMIAFFVGAILMSMAVSCLSDNSPVATWIRGEVPAVFGNDLFQTPGNNGDVVITKFAIVINKQFDNTGNESITDGGTVTGDGIFTSGTKCTISAVPNALCQFDGFYEGERLVTKDATYTFVLNYNITYTAKFSIAG
jgi:hypothetical protein